MVTAGCLVGVEGGNGDGSGVVISELNGSTGSGGGDDEGGGGGGVRLVAVPIE